MVDEHGYPTVGPFLGEPGLFLYVLADVDRLPDVIRLAVDLLQLFEDDVRFVS